MDLTVPSRGGGPLAAGAFDQQAATIDNLRAALLRRCGPSVAGALAAVELAVAVHAVVPDPAASVVWDPGEHALPHRLLLGAGDDAREDLAPSAGRVVSEAVGRAVARTLRGDSQPVVVVVDDGGLSTGMAYEAVAHAGQLQLPVVLILIDRQTHRSRSSGFMGHHLTRIRGHPRYAEAKALIESALRSMPAGDQAVEVARRLKNSIRELLVPTEMWEEQLGFMYLGPVDGHNLASLRKVLTLALQARRPIVVHAVVQAGRGLAPTVTGGAQARPALASPWLASLAGAVQVWAAADERVVVVTAGGGRSDGLQRFAETYPERYFDVALGEAHAVAFAAGLAGAGMIPLVALSPARLARAAAPLAAAGKLGGTSFTVLLCPDGGAPSAPADDVQLGRALPGIAVLVPPAPDELPSLIRWAAAFQRPALVRVPARAPLGDFGSHITHGASAVVWGAAEAALAIVACGPTAVAARRAASRVAASAVAVVRLAPPPPVQDLEPRAQRWVLVRDPEFGGALTDIWPRERHAATRMIDLDPDEPIERQVATIVAAASAG